MGLDSLNQSRSLREKVRKDWQEVEEKLHLDGEDDWMLNMCRKKKGSKKECYPDDK